MQDVTITFTRGPQSGTVFEFELGQLVIGREPGDPGLELENADSSISRKHAELQENNGQVELVNLSPNGTQVDGELVTDKIGLHPGAELVFSNSHTLTVNWASFVRKTNGSRDTSQAESDSGSGPLGSPAVRAILVLYLLGMVAIAVWLSGSEEDSGVLQANWPALREQYVAYRTDAIPEDVRKQRLAHAQLLLREIRALEVRGLREDIEPLCREVMDIDSDIHSPLFRFGVECLAAANAEELEY